MWLWQQRQRNVSQLWTRLLVISVGMHCIALVLLLVMYRGSPADYHIQIGTMLPRSEGVVVFVPLAKSIQRKQTSTRTGTKSAKRPAIPTHKKKVVAKKKKTTPKISPKAKASAKTSVKKIAPKKKVIPEKKVLPEKAKKIEESVQEPAVIPEKIEISEPDRSQSGAQAPEHAVQEKQEIVYIGQAERDALEMERLIQQEVENMWRPPMGLSKDLVCDIKVLVGWDGKAHEVEIVNPSGVLVYDIHARATVVAMTFPRAAYGKQLCMHFKQ